MKIGANQARSCAFYLYFEYMITKYEMTKNFYQDISYMFLKTEARIMDLNF